MAHRLGHKHGWAAGPRTALCAGTSSAREPGTWDDSGVKDAWVITDEMGEHLWYSGFDGDAWRIGYAFRAEGEQAFTRSVLAGSDDPRYLIDYADSPFHRTDVTRPVVQQTADGFEMTYGGWILDTVAWPRLRLLARPLQHHAEQPTRRRYADVQHELWTKTEMPSRSMATRTVARPPVSGSPPCTWMKSAALRVLEALPRPVRHRCPR